jgi:hypothetical protein
VRRQSEASTALWILACVLTGRAPCFYGIQSGVALRLPPHSKFRIRAMAVQVNVAASSFPDTDNQR